MRIIKHGTKKRWAIDCHCTGEGNGSKGCGAVLKVYDTDFFRTFLLDGTSVKSFVTFRCIDCGALTDVDATRIPVDPLSLPTQARWEKE